MDNNNNDDNNQRAQRRALTDLTVPLVQPNSFLENRTVTRVLPDFQCDVDQQAFNRSAAGQRQSKAWCFTINNPTERCRIQLDLNTTEPIILDIAYAVWSKEIGEERQTPHIQGYIRCNRKKRAYQIVRDFIRYWQHGCWPFFTVARGSDSSNKEYIEKSPLPFSENDVAPYLQSIGDCQSVDMNVSQGKRSDIMKFMEHTASNFEEDEIDLAMRFPKLYMRHQKAFMRFRELSRARHLSNNYGEFQRSSGVLIKIYWGVSNAGKSYTVKQDIRTNFGVDPEGGAVFWKSQPKWNNGYIDQRIIVLDDFRASWMPMWALLKLCDPSPYSWEVKGSMVPVLAHTIYITSPFSPEYWYKGEDSYTQIMNRVLFREPIGEIRHFPVARENSFIPPAQAAGFMLPIAGVGEIRHRRGRVTRPRGRERVCECNNLVCRCFE